MKRTLTFTAAIIFSLNVFSQAPAIQWQRSLGGTSDDWGYSSQATTDGGCIVTGITQSTDGDVTGYHGGTFDCWVVKLDNNGFIQWKKTFGGTNRNEGYSIRQASDGGYILAVSSDSNDGDVTGNHGGHDFWVVKMDAAGTLQWQKCYGGTSSDAPYSVEQTNDGGYIIAGFTGSNDGDVTGVHGASDCWLVKVDSGGTIQWQKSLGGTGDESATAIRQSLDGGYIMAGFSNSNDGDVSGHHGFANCLNCQDYWVVKLNGNGVIQWQNSFGGTLQDMAQSVEQTIDGGYIVAGSSKSNDGDATGHHGTFSDYWVVKLDSNGNIEWQKSLGGTQPDDAYSICLSTNGGYVVSGISISNDGDVTSTHLDEVWIVKLNNNGSIGWQACYGGTGLEVANSISITSDGGYIFGGYSFSNDGDVSGHHGAGNRSDYWVVKLSPDVGIEENRFVSSTTLSPNPFHESAILSINANNFEEGTLEIKNVLGETVAQPKYFTGNKITIQRNNLSRGVYFYTVTTREKGILNGKFIVD